MLLIIIGSREKKSCVSETPNIDGGGKNTAVLVFLDRIGGVMPFIHQYYTMSLLVI